ncbi:AAA family ATPase [Lachnospiraceae bacterium JLR.KK009]|nr:hypothetical protein C810_00942 [Lachnospiraceae bacterium A2]MCI8706069.1 AAA family ATPase [Lachnospiraceae bacterium]
MFTKVKLKNYKSLVDLEVDLKGTKNQPKPLIIIYGENGVGKSNFAASFLTLSESLQTMSLRKVIQQFMEETMDGIPKEFVVKMISQNLRDTETIIKNCKTINSKGNMLLEFGFIIGRKHGNYILEYDDTKLVHERLDYALNKNKTNLYDITLENIKINDKLFLDSEYAKELKELLVKYRGKHSFLSILLSEKEEKADGYVEEKVSGSLFDVINRFRGMSLRVKTGNKGERGRIGVPHKILGELIEGEIDVSEEAELDQAQELLNEFFSQAYSDIKGAYYRKEYREHRIEYELVFRKLIYGKVVDIAAESESTGTLHLLDILPFLLMGVKGKAVVIDELDTGIHDLLVNSILSNVLDSIRGQLIITTHNTMLLETEIDPSCIYTFYVDKDANKYLEPIVAYEGRAHPNLNYRNRYLKGMYGGIPMVRDIDFDELWDIFD